MNAYQLDMVHESLRELHEKIDRLAASPCCAKTDDLRQRVSTIGFAAVEIEQLRAALQEIVNLRLVTDEGTCARRFDLAWEVARRALGRAAATLPR